MTLETDTTSGRPQPHSFSSESAEEDDLSVTTTFATGGADEPTPAAEASPGFVVRKPAIFGRTPPAIFSVTLGLLGLGLALKRVTVAGELPPALPDAVMGFACGLWIFCALAYGIKVVRRRGVVMEDLAILPGRAGLASGSVGTFAFAATLSFFQPTVAAGALVLGFALHLTLSVLTVKALLAAPAEAREVTPAWHLSFVGFIVGALAAVPLGWVMLASSILWITMAFALFIWTISLWQLWKRTPPAPLRPLLAIHLAPASLFASVAGLLGFEDLAQGMVLLGLVILIALVASGEWIIEAGFTPLWGAFTFPLAAFASALVINGWVLAGVLLTVIALGFIPMIAWRVLSMWPGGKLAAKTNAAQA